MLRTIGISLFAMASLLPSAAQSIDAAFRLTETDSSWVLEMELSEDGVSSTMEGYLDEGLLRDLSREEYEREILEYVKTHFRLRVDGRLTTIGLRSLKADDEAALLTFDVSNIPIRPRLMEVQIPMFDEQPDQRNLLAVDRIGAPLKNFELTPNNNFKVRVAFTNGDLIETAHNDSLGLWSMTLYALVFIALGVIFWVLTKTLWATNG